MRRQRLVVLFCFALTVFLAPIAQAQLETLALYGESLVRFERAIVNERLRVAKDARRAEPLRIPEGRPGPLPSRTPDDPTGERFTRSHRFWSYQDVLDEYGDPNEVHVRDGLLWWYYNDPDRDVTFVFYDGLCTATYD